MKFTLSQNEVSQLIVKHLIENNLTKVEKVTIQYDITDGEKGNELSVTIEED